MGRGRAFLTALGLLGLVLGACAPAGPAPTPAAPTPKPIKIAIVSDIGGRGISALTTWLLRAATMPSGTSGSKSSR